MYRLVFTVALGVGLLVLCEPAAAQSANTDIVYPGNAAGDLTDPGDIKAAYDHDGKPMPLDHDGNPVSNMHPVPWFWHPAEDMVNVAGFRFSVHYDSYEALVDLVPAGQFIGHDRVQYFPGHTDPAAREHRGYVSHHEGDGMA